MKFSEFLTVFVKCSQHIGPNVGPTFHAYHMLVGLFLVLVGLFHITKLLSDDFATAKKIYRIIGKYFLIRYNFLQEQKSPNKLIIRLENPSLVNFFPHSDEIRCRDSGVNMHIKVLGFSSERILSLMSYHFPGDNLVFSLGTSYEKTKTFLWMVSEKYQSD